MANCVHLKLAAILFVYHVTLTECREENEKKDAKYIIIGAGISGLTAAKNLIERGETDILILEGYSKIGGRVRSEVVNGLTLEMGCQWLNSRSSPIAELANRVNLQVRSSNYEDYVYLNKNGTDITELADERYLTFTPAYDYMNDLAFDLRHDDNKKPDLPVRAALALGGWIPRDSLDFAMEFYDLDFVYGQEPEVTSTRYSAIPSFGNASTYDEQVVVDQNGGLFKLVRRLYDDVMSGDRHDVRVLLNRVVVNVTYAEDDVTVTTADGTSFTGDYVIVTVSLGVLQHDVIAFNPPLPDWKRYSLMSATYVIDFPIYVIVPADRKPFWADREFFVYVDDRRGYYTLWQNYDLLLDGSRVLQIQMTGSEARRVSRLGSEQIQAEVRSVLASMFALADLPDVHVIVPRWATDELQYGSYADWSPHFTISSFEALRAPVGRMYFAGEAYHQSYFGYLEGAYQSAIDVTNELMACDADPTRCRRYLPTYEADGCTYPAAVNYDSKAQVDDGSCQFVLQPLTPTSGCCRRSTKAMFVFSYFILLFCL